MRPNRLLSIARVLVLFGNFFADSVFAGPVQYDFSYTPTTGPIQPFTFQIVSSNGFIVGGPPGITPLSFVPFSFTDGTNRWEMLEGLAVDLGCFVFDTLFGQFGGRNCTLAPLSIGSGVLRVDLPNGSYPTSAGTYLVGALAEGLTIPPPLPPPVLVQGTGTVSLTVTEIPEPATYAMVALGLLGVLLIRSKASHN
jgi:hypothetical protein